MNSFIRLILLLAFTGTGFCAAAQDRDHAEYIELVNYERDRNIRKETFFRRSHADGYSLQFTYFKKTKQVRYITAHNRALRSLILYLYFDDKIVMISPVGQQPYYILDNTFIYSEHSPLNIAEINELIIRANKYLELAHKRIAKKG